MTVLVCFCGHTTEADWVPVCPRCGRSVPDLMPKKKR